MKKTRLIFRQAVELFEYGKNNKKYWYGPKFYKQLVTKALSSIAEVLYPGYLLYIYNEVSDGLGI